MVSRKNYYKNSLGYIAHGASHRNKIFSTQISLELLILNGLGFANRPLSLTPQFFANKPLDLLFRQGIDAEMFNRFKLGRTLDEASAYGCDLLFQELALAICAQEGIDLRFNHLDTTSFALTGEYVPDSDEHGIRITHGYSKDHRPDLKQAVLELMVSQDGGVPFVSKSWDGNTSDTQVFQQRAEGVDACLQGHPHPPAISSPMPNSTVRTMPSIWHRLALSPVFPPPSRWLRRSLAKRSSGIPGRRLMTTPAISRWRCATMVWPSVGWWCIHQRSFCAC